LATLAGRKPIEQDNQLAVWRARIRQVIDGGRLQPAQVRLKADTTEVMNRSRGVLEVEIRKLKS